MGQKVNAIGYRLKVNRTWNSIWYSKEDYAEKLHKDLSIRKFIFKDYKNSGISSVDIERAAKKTRINIRTSRPGMMIGKKGEGLEKLKNSLEKINGSEVSINLLEEKRPETDPKLIAEDIARQLEKRMPFRKILKRSVQVAMRMGAKGIRVNVSGRLGGADIARTEWYREGRVPLHTLRANIDYGIAEAHTVYGIIGIKVWVYKENKTKNQALSKKEV